MMNTQQLQRVVIAHAKLRPAGRVPEIQASVKSAETV